MRFGVLGIIWSDRSDVTCGEHCATVQIKDDYLEGRFVVHVSESIAGTGMTAIDTILRRTEALARGTRAVVEHLSLSRIGRTRCHLVEPAAALGIEVH